jgi:sugar phosphate isomerase/epimerase
MDALAPWAIKHNVRMALENTQPHNFNTLERFFAMCGPEVMGLCYDSGHGNVQSHGRCDAIARLEGLRLRVIDLHLHDNDASDDLHWPPFTGTVDWERLARIIPTTSYGKDVIPIEATVGIKNPTPSQEMRFLKKVAGIARRFGEMVEKARQEMGIPAR